MATQELFIQPEFQFPQQLTDKYRPRRIADFVGLEKPKNVCRRLAANPVPSAWLFRGPSGVGKTTLALALANEGSFELHHVPSQECNVENIERVRHTCQYVPQAGKRAHLVLIDEADQMTRAAQISLLSKLDATNPAPNTIWILTANDTANLEPRFLSRCHVVDFSSYGISSEVVQLLERIWVSESASDSHPNFARIVKDSSNNVRESLMRLETELMMA